MEEGEFRELSADLLELAVNIGLIASVMPQYPVEVQENWDEKLRGIRQWAQQTTEEVQMFAEAYDDQPEDGQMEE